ncbi:methionyl-tRNA formyltransferase [Spectribacter hydrogenoxidans]|uniref:Methionyl-tRNA formyltransferase n=1 Tax=Spectribacter hydrogenoxidans TaxID=3075608 RepID=A0ABU3BZL5_9GAMM|nr:methionyl-tRNA formyltransferase [Salinisphaera sp. W335]MDT0634757.1 methionyl-tRNA formyltransferase [Salinisphaera sp. W335]
MRILFAGTPGFALPSLDAVADSGHELVGVMTQPDRPAGRGRHLQASPIKQRALELGMPVLQPETLRARHGEDEIRALRPDLAVVAAYGLLLPGWMLSLPAQGCINVHASLLPRWRGAAPIARAILAGDSLTGITLMRMARGLDTGDILAQEATAIGPGETAGELHDRLAGLGGGMLPAMLDALARGEVAGRVQDEAAATHARRLDKAEAALDWRQSAVSLSRAVRAFNPWPVAHGGLDGERVRVWRAEAIGGAAEADPGTVVAADAAGIDVATGNGQLRITELQWPGRRRLPAAEVARGRPLVGKRFE